MLFFPLSMQAGLVQLFTMTNITGYENDVDNCSEILYLLTIS